MFEAGFYKPVLLLAFPLAGLRILHLTRPLAGPSCAMALADLGADVVEVEPRPADDPHVDGRERPGIYHFIMAVDDLSAIHEVSICG